MVENDSFSSRANLSIVSKILTHFWDCRYGHANLAPSSAENASYRCSRPSHSTSDLTRQGV
ncbi:hypothetical protein CVS53_02380 [Microbacterium oxydans]|jgi:hypothetical protein|nr:hypothetical protein CVS53_02380 [Microbacterium oxydans]